VLQQTLQLEYCPSESLMTQSSHTYREFFSEYESTEDYRMWNSERLDDECAMVMFNQEDIYISMTTDTIPQGLSEPSTIFMRQEDEFVAEGMVTVPDLCKDTIERLTNGIDLDSDSMVVCMSRYGAKDLVFTLPGCVLCSSGQRQDVYIPMNFITKIYYDLSAKYIQCNLPKEVRRMPYYRSTIHENVSIQPELLYIRRRITPDHQPMYSDGHQTYSIVSATIYVSLEPRRSLSDSDYGTGKIVSHNSRRIHVSVLAIGSYATMKRNNVAGYTSHGGSTTIY
jgi:hypothetical protein